MKEQPSSNLSVYWESLSDEELLEKKHGSLPSSDIYESAVAESERRSAAIGGLEDRRAMTKVRRLALWVMIATGVAVSALLAVLLIRGS